LGWNIRSRKAEGQTEGGDMKTRRDHPIGIGASS
jgi:hypothetical protein